MTTIVSAAASSWRAPNGADTDAARRFDELVKPQMERDRAENIRSTWVLNGIAIGVGALGIGLGMAFAGAHGMAAPMLGSSFPRNFLRGAATGAVGAGILSGAMTGIIAMGTRGDAFRSSDHQKAAWPEQTRQAYEAYNRK